MPVTEAQKRATNKWRDNHREYYNQIQNVYTKISYEKNRDKRLEYGKQYYARKKAEKLEKLQQAEEKLQQAEEELQQDEEESAEIIQPAFI